MRLFPKSKVETVPKSKVETVTGFAAPGAAAPGRISRPIYTQIVVADRPSALVQLRAFLPDEVSVDAAPSVMDIVIVKIPVLFTSRRLAAMLEPDVSAMLERAERMLEREMLARNIEFTDMDSVFVTVECPRCSEHFRHGADDDGDDDDDSGRPRSCFGPAETEESAKLRQIARTKIWIARMAEVEEIAKLRQIVRTKIWIARMAEAEEIAMLRQIGWRRRISRAPS